MDSLLDILEYLSEKKVIRQLDYQFALFIVRQCHQDHAEVAWLSALVSYELSRGHIAVPLCDLQGKMNEDWLTFGLGFDETGLFNQQEEFKAQIAMTDWLDVIQRCPLIGQPEANLPLIFDGARLYLQRYWYYESQLAIQLRRLSAPVPLTPTEMTVLAQQLNQLFPRNYDLLWRSLHQVSSSIERQRLVCEQFDVVDDTQLDWHAIESVLMTAQQGSDLVRLEVLIPCNVCLNWQKIAAATALTRKFTVISGGPGTGKTTTVTKLLAALVAQAGEQTVMPLIKLVAPTGKASARLTESIGQAIERLALPPEIKSQIPTQSSTLHRLLGAIPNSAEFRHHAKNPLHVDVLVVDEASMVDLPMMYKLLTALPDHTRVIFLGDKDQLASVEAGAILGDICSFQAYGFSRSQQRVLEQLTGYCLPSLTHQSEVPDIADGLCMLQKSYRFHSRSGIGQLARAVNTGGRELLDDVLQQSYSDVQIYPLQSQSYNQMIETLIEAYGGYLALIEQRSGEDNEAIEVQAKRVIQQFNQCRLLCAVREGDFGVTGLNQRIEALLQRRQMIQREQEPWYVGRPVMVTKNDHHLGIYNGDIGICLKEIEDGRDIVKVYFEQFDGSVKGFIPSRIPEHETAYAMTVHKSQGSEFDFTLMILPPEYSPILTRELVYTGITRAKNKLHLYTDIHVLKRAIRTQTQRTSGLVVRLSE